MNFETKPWVRRLILAWTATVIVFLYIPIVSMVMTSFVQSRYFRFPVKAWSTKWYQEMLGANLTQDLHLTSLYVAMTVAVCAVVIGFFGALAFARYDWKGRKTFQRLLMFPIFFPQAVLGLALLLWLTYVGVTPSWEAAVFTHLVWIVPIVTLVISIQVYGYDTSQEEAAFDLGASRWQVFREVTLPALAPGLFSGALFAFLLSWVNFPLSTYTTGADSTVTEWLYTKMIAAYTPMVPAMAALSVYGAVIILFAGYAILLARRRKAASAS
ncbi:MAG: ABC transporter permease [Gammaproteobacteria bacterium]|nr:ABC transporter permease [Gammaproteobacteria bacterium]